MSFQKNGINNTIVDLIQEGEKIRAKYPEIWKYESELAFCKTLLNSGMTPTMIQQTFYSSKLARYDSFADYIKSQDITTLNYKFPTIIKKAKRSKRCPFCGGEKFNISKEGVFVCLSCGSELPQKTDHQLVTKELVDPTKHIMKQLKILTNETKIPNNFSKIIPFVAMWFKDKSYMKEYLIFSNKVNTWLAKYKKIVGKEIDISFFDTELEDTTTDYNLYKLYTDSFYEMTADMISYRNRQTNMLPMSESTIFSICESYYETYKMVPFFDKEAPLVYNFEVDGIETKCEIGEYIARQLVSDMNSTTPLKQNLERIFQRRLYMPGLMFSYDEQFVGVKTLKIPKKFNYQQYYPCIVHEIYNIPYENVHNVELNNICDIMMDFNEFVKNIKASSTGKKGNSILWHVNLTCVLKLPYFRCYRPMLKLLPTRMSTKILPIFEYWTSYVIRNYEKLRVFINTLRLTKDPELSKTKVTKVEYVVDKQDLLDFITDTGASYNHSVKDEYLKDKLHIKDKDPEWKSAVTLGKKLNIEIENENPEEAYDEEAEEVYDEEDEEVYDEGDEEEAEEEDEHLFDDEEEVDNEGNEDNFFSSPLNKNKFNVDDYSEEDFGDDEDEDEF